MYPDIPIVRVFRSNLKDIVFPISFKMCVEDTINTNNKKRFENIGYASEWNYFRGQSRFDERRIGWNGHTANGSTLGSTEDILSKASLDWKNILLSLKVIENEREYVKWTNDFKWSMADYRGCKLINLSQYFNMSEIVPTSIRLEFARQENRSVSIKIQDFRKATIRALNSNHFDYIGPPIQLNDLISPSILTYAVKISSFVDLEEDPGKKCVNYPTKEFESYQECDQEFLHKEIKQTYDIMPFWASKSDAEVTKSKLVKMSGII